MFIKIWVEMSGLNCMDEMIIEIPDDLTEKEIDDTAMEYRSNLMQWGYAIAKTKKELENAK